MDVLDSMAEIYDHVNLIDFVNNTEMSLRDASQTKHGIDMKNQTQTLMNQMLKKNVMPDQLEEFNEFTNIKTVRSRLTNFFCQIKCLQVTYLRFLGTRN